MCPIECLKYVRAFRAFYSVVLSCFGNDINPNFKRNVKSFRDAYADLSITVTPKIHAVFHHVIEFCDMRESGLGPYSEQCTESVHHDFNCVWQHFKVSPSHSDCGTHLLKAVRVYNSRHV